MKQLDDLEPWSVTMVDPWRTTKTSLTASASFLVPNAASRRRGCSAVWRFCSTVTRAFGYAGWVLAGMGAAS
jgi:hypothetical protein